jgi:hypothetical protein
MSILNVTISQTRIVYIFSCYVYTSAYMNKNKIKQEKLCNMYML